MIDVITVTLTADEAQALAGITEQFRDLVHEAAADDGSPADPAVLRLVPDAHADDAEAAAEFRSLTQADALRRRRSDADVVLSHLATHDDAVAEGHRIHLSLTPDSAAAWLRTLAALRLVLASRLGIVTESDHDEDDPRFAVYDWLGMRLELLVQEIDAL